MHRFDADRASEVAENSSAAERIGGSPKKWVAEEMRFAESVIRRKWCNRSGCGGIEPSRRRKMASAALFDPAGRREKLRSAGASAAWVAARKSHPHDRAAPSTAATGGSGGARLASERSAAMHCREAIDLLSEYLSGALPWRRRALLWLHLRLCPDCRNYVASFRRTLLLVRSSARDVASDPPPAISDALVQAIQAARSARK